MLNVLPIIAAETEPKAEGFQLSSSPCQRTWLRFSRMWIGAVFDSISATNFSTPDHSQATERRFTASPEGVLGPVTALELSLNTVRDLGRAAETAGDSTVSVAGKITNPSHYLTELSNGLCGERKAPIHSHIQPLAGLHRSDRHAK